MRNAFKKLSKSPYLPSADIEKKNIIINFNESISFIYWFSLKTKGFCYLLVKNNFSKIKFVNIIKNVYFADVNYLNDIKIYIALIKLNLV